MEVSKVLIEHGAEINATTTMDHSPIHLAVFSGITFAVFQHKNPKNIKETFSICALNRKQIYGSSFGGKWS